MTTESAIQSFTKAPMTIKLSMIVAMANNRAIGKDNQLLWHLPEDLKYFKRVTMGKPMVMGRKTYESIGRPLPGRLNIVVTRQTDWQCDGVKVVHSIDEALIAATAYFDEQYAEDVAGENAVTKKALLEEKQHEVMVIGGAEIYRTALPHTQTLYLTRVDAEIDGDAFFPEVDDAQWSEIGRDSFSASDNNPYDYAFCVLERVRS